ncbi:MAG: hypothetical protein P9M03_07530 [Candidatus Theseobacter exili]|nr:hypothetical protein [Candidatus Theseobacter exili]
MDSSFLCKPWYEKCFINFSNNGPDIFNAIGWTLTVLAFAGTVVSIASLLNNRKQPEDKYQYLQILKSAIYIFCFFSLFISLAGKPVVQSFHFSYLQLPITLAAAEAVFFFLKNKRLLIKIVGFIAIISVCLEIGTKTIAELYYWQKEDTKNTSRLLKDEIFVTPMDVTGSKNQTVKTIMLGEDLITVFRNKPRRLFHNSAQVWSKLHIAPIPSVPLPEQHQWIFMNGPVFPRNDRMFKVSADHELTKYVVFYDCPEKVQLGIRSGYTPAKINISFSGTKKTLHLPRNTQKIISVPIRNYKVLHAAGPACNDVYVVNLNVETQLGPCIVNMISDKKELYNYRLFGGALDKPGDFYWNSAIDINKLVSETKYIQNVPGHTIHLNENKKSLLRKDFFFLPAGIYKLELDIAGLTESASLSVELADEADCIRGNENKKLFTVNPGRQTVSYSFLKKFAPYEINIRLNCNKGECIVLGWKITPDTSSIIQSLDKWKSSGITPEWLGYGYNLGIKIPDTVASNIVFQNRYKLKSLHIPSVIPRRKKFLIHEQFEILKHNTNNFYETYVFLHLKNSEGKIVCQFDHPLRLASFGNSPPQDLQYIIPKKVKPGIYYLYMGLYNKRTRKRYNIKIKGPKRPVSDQSFLAAEIEVIPKAINK